MTPDKPKKVEEMFHVKKVLGKGNSAGEVYMVEDAATGKDYALKPVIGEYYSVKIMSLNPDNL